MEEQKVKVVAMHEGKAETRLTSMLAVAASRCKTKTHWKVKQGLGVWM